MKKRGQKSPRGEGKMSASSKLIGLLSPRRRGTLQRGQQSPGVAIIDPNVNSVDPVAELRGNIMFLSEKKWKKRNVHLNRGKVAIREQDDLSLVPVLLLDLEDVTQVIEREDAKMGQVMDLDSSYGTYSLSPADGTEFRLWMNSLQLEVMKKMAGSIKKKATEVALDSMSAPQLLELIASSRRKCGDSYARLRQTWQQSCKVTGDEVREVTRQQYEKMVKEHKGTITRVCLLKLQYEELTGGDVPSDGQDPELLKVPELVFRRNEVVFGELSLEELPAQIQVYREQCYSYLEDLKQASRDWKDAEPADRNELSEKYQWMLEDHQIVRNAILELNARYQQLVGMDREDEAILEAQVEHTDPPQLVFADVGVESFHPLVPDEMVGEPRPAQQALSYAVGDIVWAIYSEDQLWYQARIDSIVQDGYWVTFTEYGNEQLCSESTLREMEKFEPDEEDEESTAAKEEEVIEQDNVVTQEQEHFVEEEQQPDIASEQQLLLQQLDQQIDVVDESAAQPAAAEPQPEPEPKPKPKGPQRKHTDRQTYAEALRIAKERREAAKAKLKANQEAEPTPPTKNFKKPLPIAADLDYAEEDGEEEQAVNILSHDPTAAAGSEEAIIFDSADIGSEDMFDRFSSEEHAVNPNLADDFEMHAVDDHYQADEYNLQEEPLETFDHPSPYEEEEEEEQGYQPTEHVAVPIEDKYEEELDVGDAVDAYQHLGIDDEVDSGVVDNDDDDDYEEELETYIQREDFNRSVKKVTVAEILARARQAASAAAAVSNSPTSAKKTTGTTATCSSSTSAKKSRGPPRKPVPGSGSARPPRKPIPNIGGSAARKQISTNSPPPRKPIPQSMRRNSASRDKLPPRKPIPKPSDRPPSKPLPGPK